MSEHENKQTCGHLECGDYMGRREYCETVANTVGEATSLSMEMIEELLYDEARMSRGTLRFTASDTVHLYERQFSFLHSTANAPLLKTTVSIAHNNERELHDAFTVEATWQSYHDNIKGSFVTRYVLERWPGVVQSTISEYDSTMACLMAREAPAFRDRTMTSYDHEQLFALLATVYDVYEPRARDNLAETV